MKLIIFSPPNDFKDEIAIVTALFEAGMERFHLRKPSFSKEKMENYIKLIPEKYRNKIVIHSFHELQKKIGLGGIHFTSKSIIPDVLIEKERKFTISGSAHSFEEIEKKAEKVDYLFLSPIFDSISKYDYKSNFNPIRLKSFLNNKRKAKIFALGGIDEINITEAAEIGFDGVAVLGAVWSKENINKATDTFIVLNKLNTVPKFPSHTRVGQVVR